MCLASHSDMQNPSAADLSAGKFPVKSVHRRREPKYVQILSQNTRGFNDEKEETILALMQQKQTFAYAVQETWKLGNELYEKYGFLVIQHGSNVKPLKGHPSGGVAIILSPEARKAWVAAGSCVQHFGDRILAIKLELLDAYEKPVTVVLVSAYAPIGAAKESIRQDFATELERCMEAPKSNEVLLICINANASMGSRLYLDRHDQVLGPFGINYINSAGRALHDLLDSKDICSATTFFQKPRYATWRNPRSKKEHQLDHFLINRKDLPRIRDAGIDKLTIDSDHDPLQLKLRVARNLSKQNDNKGNFINRSLLRDPEIASNFRKIVLQHLAPGQEGLTYPALKDAVTLLCMFPLKRCFQARNDDVPAGSAKANRCSWRQYEIAIRLKQTSIGNVNQVSLSRILNMRFCRTRERN